MKKEMIKVLAPAPGDKHQIALINVEAMVQGDWAFHEAVNLDDGTFTVTHIPSGHAGYFGPKRLCRVMVKRLAERSKHVWHPSERQKNQYSKFNAETRAIRESVLEEFKK